MASDTPQAAPCPALGALHCATITVPDARAAAQQYAAALGMARLESGLIAPELARSWDAEHLAGARYELVGPTDGDQPLCFIRFVEQAPTPGFTPYLSTGWTALEFTVGDSDHAIHTLRQAGFTVVGEAADLDFAAGALRAGQVAGPYGEILYLTQVKSQLSGFALPQRQEGVGKLFICILVSDNMQECIAHYVNALGCEERGGFATEVPFIARYHGLAEDTLITLGTVEIAPENYLEIDQMPAPVPQREVAPGFLLPGIAIISVKGDPEGSAAAASAIAEPLAGEGAVYSGARVVTLRGFHGELIEVIG